MKKLILLFCVAVSFVACKKNSDLTKQNPSDEYSGIKNVTEFDNVMKEILQDGSSSSRLQKTIKLSKEAVLEMRNNIQFDKQGRFRGFTSNKLMNEELSLNDRQFLLGQLTKTEIMIFDKDNKIIANPINPKGRISYPHDGWYWKYSNCCWPKPTATCVTIDGGINCP